MCYSSPSLVNIIDYNSYIRFYYYNYVVTILLCRVKANRLETVED